MVDSWFIGEVYCVTYRAIYPYQGHFDVSMLAPPLIPQVPIYTTYAIVFRSMFVPLRITSLQWRA